jgi:hypothetical protein
MSPEGWAAIAVAVATAILVVVTVYYACQTKRMAEGQEQMRKDALRPMITGDLKLTTSVSTVPDPRVTLRNSGGGPASNVGIRFDNPARHYFYEEWLPAIAVHEQSKRIDLRYRSGAAELTETKVEDICSLVVEYDDVFGTSFKTTFRAQLQALLGWKDLNVTTEQIASRTILAPVSTDWQRLRREREQQQQPR